MLGAGKVNLIDGGMGDDLVDYSRFDGVNVDLSISARGSTGVSSDIIRNVEGIIGSAGADHLSGNDFDNIIEGGMGNDTMEGGIGADTFLFDGNFGHDKILDFGEADKVELVLSEGSTYEIQDNELVINNQGVFNSVSFENDFELSEAQIIATVI